MQLLDVPLAAQSDPRARLYIIDHLRPGTTIRRRIEFSNTTPSAVQIAIYPAAAAITQGAFLGAAGHTANDLSTWTSVSPATSEIPPGAHRIAVVTIAVPSAAPPGESYGVIWGETRSAPPAGSGIIQVSRVGIRLYVSVGPGGAPASNFTIGSPIAGRAADGQPFVLATVHNTGGRALDMNGTLQLSAGPGGLSAGPFPANLGVSLAIGSTEPITIMLDRRVPDGPWNAVLTLRSGLLERSIRATITFPAIRARSSPFPTITAGLIAALLIAIAAALLITRRRRS